MKTTERLKALAERIIKGDCAQIMNPKEVKELCELVELMEEALQHHTNLTRPIHATNEALSRVAKFQKGE